MERTDCPNLKIRDEAIWVDALLGCLSWAERLKNSLPPAEVAKANQQNMPTECTLFLLGIVSTDRSLRRWLASCSESTVPFPAPSDSPPAASRLEEGLLR